MDHMQALWLRFGTVRYDFPLSLFSMVYVPGSYRYGFPDAGTVWYTPL